MSALDKENIVKEEVIDLTKESLNDLVNNLLELLEKKEFKKKLVKKLNKNINIPIINEKTEHKILDSLYDDIIDTLKKIDLEDV